MANITGTISTTWSGTLGRLAYWRATGSLEDGGFEWGDGTLWGQQPSASGSVSTPTNITGTISTIWGGWSGTSAATVDHPATATGVWSGTLGRVTYWRATGSLEDGGFEWGDGTLWGQQPSARGFVSRAAVINTTWDGWSGTANGLVDHKATISTTWGGWSGTAAAIVDHPATASGTWDGWAGTAAAVVSRKAVISTTWDGWIGTAVIPDGGLLVYVGGNPVTAIYLGADLVSLA